MPSVRAPPSSSGFLVGVFGAASNTFDDDAIGSFEDMAAHASGAKGATYGVKLPRRGVKLRTRAAQKRFRTELRLEEI